MSVIVTVALLVGVEGTRRKPACMSHSLTHPPSSPHPETRNFSTPHHAC